MDKILNEYRRQIGNFEVVEVIDEQKIASLRERIDISAPVNVHWSWDYAGEIEELRRLYEKGKVSQWNAETDLDWNMPVSKDDWVLNPEASLLAQICKLMGKDEATQKAAAFDELAYSFSQLLHGEQAALQLCGQLTNVCDDMDQKFYAASQVIDEARHVEVISKMLQRKFETIYPIGSTLKVLLDILLEVPGMKFKVLGMQTLFEGTALGIMSMIKRECRVELVREMLHRVEQDESRHAAFGVLNMRRIVRDASAAEMAEMEDWAYNVLETLNANQQLDMLHHLAPKYGFEPELIVQGFTQLENFAELNSEPFMHTVVPNLLNLGLISDRTRDKWISHGMMIPGTQATRNTLPIAG